VTTPARSTRATSTAELAAGFLAVLSIVGSGVAVAYRPVRIIPFAILLALIATGMAPRGSRLPLIAVLIGGACFIAGMTIAVVTRNPIY
jgi:hypothetical protein